MKICEKCGAQLEATAACVCADSMQAVLAEPETADLARMLKGLPDDVAIEIKGMIKGAALVAANRTAG